MLNASSSLQSICSLQSSSGPPESRKFRRLNGLQLPLHPQQIIAWIVVVILPVGTFINVLPHLSSSLRIPITAILALTLVLHLLAHVLAESIDPSDPQVRKQPSNNVVPEFDRTKHLHVIENGRCHLCNITITSKRTKHCSVCNKCVKHFDHHCMWLNNCIGGRNYKCFIACLITAIVFTITLVALVFGEVLITIEDGFSGNLTYTMENITIPIASWVIQPIQNTSTLIIITIVGVLSAVAAALLIHLCIFHGYIAYLGLTTYEYVKNKREQQQQQQQQQQRALVRETKDSDLERYHHHHHHFCKDVNADDAVTNENQVYICSTHTSQNSIRNKEKRNFHLYFTYETQEDATSFELTSQSLGDRERRIQELGEVKVAEVKPLTPSPVSCCFSIMNHGWSDRKKKKLQNGHRNEEEKVVTTRCTPVRRIQTFLRSRLRKNARQRGLDSSTRGRKNRIGPMIGPSGQSNEEENKCPALDDKTLEVFGNVRGLEELPVRPIKLPPLNLPSREDHHDVIHENGVFTLPISKRSQQLRIRRPSFHRRPRFKMSPHVTQSAQLSPIPESEFSKPASPRSPPKLKHFSFPPTSTD